MTTLIVLILAYQSLPRPEVGTYQVAQSGSQIIRVDTRTGNAERCSIVADKFVCKEMK